MNEEEFNAHELSFGSETESYIDEDKLIEDAITTPYEKVLMILTKIKKFILGLDPKNHGMAKEVDWVIKKISSHSLYTYEISNEKEDMEKFKEDPEIRNFLDFLSDCAEQPREFYRRNTPFGSKTVTMSDSQKQSLFELGLQMPSTTLKKKDVNMLTVPNLQAAIHPKRELSPEIKMKTSQKGLAKNKQNESIPEYPKGHAIASRGKNNTKCTPYLSFNNLTMKNLSSTNHEKSSTSLVIIREDNFENKKIRHIPQHSLQLNLAEDKLSENMCNDSGRFMINHQHQLIKPQIDMKVIPTKEFNIFDFEKEVGYHNVLPLVGKALLEMFRVTDVIHNTHKIDDFLFAISRGYNQQVPYHNAIHGADVTQTVGVFLLNSNIEEIALTNINDIISLLCASLAHDIGHPGTNNMFHINSSSEIAITYNDQSVLENYHSSTFFAICRKPELNIFYQFSNLEYKILRKRIITLILATDMANHAKIIGIIKSRIQNAISSDQPLELISKDSNSMFEDQQKLLDLIIHLADISHNSKPFAISQQWTDQLTKEFWAQGDKEKSLGLPISFLCDRISADVPKSQISFIKGIVIPSFEVIVELFPSLKYLLENINKNLEEWGNIEGGEKKSGIAKLSPALFTKLSTPKWSRRWSNVSMIQIPLKFRGEKNPNEAKPHRLTLIVAKTNENQGGAGNQQDV